MEAKEFEKELLNALAKLTPEDIEHIRNEVGASADYTIDEEGFSSKEEMKMVEFTQEEYDEFETLKRQYDMHVIDIKQCLEAIAEDDTAFEALQEKLFKNESTREDSEVQKEFIKALTDEEDTKVVPEPRYYLHLLPNTNHGYINYSPNSGNIIVENIHETGVYKTKFTEQEILDLAKENMYPGLQIDKIRREKVED